MASSAIGNPFLYTGREWDVESGVYFYRARTYDPVAGRFLQRDPLGHVDGLNVRQYVQDKPASQVDPLGFGVSIVDVPGFDPIKTPSTDGPTFERDIEDEPDTEKLDDVVDKAVDAALDEAEALAEEALEEADPSPVETAAAAALAAGTAALFWDDISDLFGDVKIPWDITSGSRQWGRCKLKWKVGAWIQPFNDLEDITVGADAEVEVSAEVADGVSVFVKGEASASASAADGASAEGKISAGVTIQIGK